MTWEIYRTGYAIPVARVDEEPYALAEGFYATEMDRYMYQLKDYEGNVIAELSRTQLEILRIAVQSQPMLRGFLTGLTRVLGP